MRRSARAGLETTRADVVASLQAVSGKAIVSNQRREGTAQHKAGVLKRSIMKAAKTAGAAAAATQVAAAAAAGTPPPAAPTATPATMAPGMIAGAAVSPDFTAGIGQLFP